MTQESDGMGGKFSDAGHLARMILTFDNAAQTEKAEGEVHKVLEKFLTDPAALAVKLSRVQATSLIMKEADRSSLTHAIQVAADMAKPGEGGGDNKIKMHVGRTLNTLIVSLRTPKPIHETVFKDPRVGGHLAPHGSLPDPVKH